MEWQSEALVLATRVQGEQAGVVTLLTPDKGKWAGRVGGLVAKPFIAAGNGVQAVWRARLEEQLGSFKLECVAPHSAHVFDDAPRLLALSYLTALTDLVLIDRLPVPLVYAALQTALQNLCAGAPVVPLVLGYEKTLLAALGYGLDAQLLANTAPFLSLPPSWAADAAGNRESLPEAEWAAAATLTQYFLTTYALPPGRSLPVQRQSLLAPFLATALANNAAAANLAA